MVVVIAVYGWLNQRVAVSMQLVRYLVYGHHLLHDVHYGIKDGQQHHLDLIRQEMR